MVVFTGLPASDRAKQGNWDLAEGDLTCGGLASQPLGSSQMDLEPHLSTSRLEAPAQNPRVHAVVKLSVAHDVPRARVEDNVEVLMLSPIILSGGLACGGVPMDTEP